MKEMTDELKISDIPPNRVEILEYTTGLEGMITELSKGYKKWKYDGLNRFELDCDVSSDMFVKIFERIFLVHISINPIFHVWQLIYPNGDHLYHNRISIHMSDISGRSAESMLPVNELNGEDAYTLFVSILHELEYLAMNILDSYTFLTTKVHF